MRALALALLLGACGPAQTEQCVSPEGLEGTVRLQLIRGRADLCPMELNDGADRPLGMPGERVSDNYCAVEIDRATADFHVWGTATQESAAPVVYLGKVDALVGFEMCRYAWLWAEGDSIDRANVSWAY
jgi:hypothetical protein